MQHSPQLERYRQRLQRFRWSLNLLIRLLRLLRSLLLAFCVFLVWAWLRPEAWGQQVAVFVLSFVAFILVSWQKGLRMSSLGEQLLALEMAYPDQRDSAFHLQHQPESASRWAETLELEFTKQRREGFHLLRSKLASLLLPSLCLLFLAQGQSQAWTNALQSLQRAAFSLSYGAKLRLIEGAVHAEQDSFRLGRKTQELTVLEQNMIEISVVTSPDAAPMLQLKDAQDKAVQTFRLVRVNGDGERDAVGRFAVTFAIREEARMYLSTISSRTPVAIVKVKRLPVPQVDLVSPAIPEEAWPDDRPLPLEIRVKAEHPLQAVHLLIKTGEREEKELVSEVLAPDKMQLETSYSLGLESYMERDIQEIEIIAEATDRAMPTPLVGRSKPLVIKVASAYGRYRQTLDTLRQAKTEIDTAIESPKDLNLAKLNELGQRSVKQAEDSPFFDGLDRQQIRQLQMTFSKLEKNFDMQSLVQASEDLNRFLFEHESLDDRERDRDFFVAARTLSRLLEQNAKERKVPVDKVVDRMQQFLEERHRRWEMRVSRLQGEQRPSEWNEVQKKPFTRALESMQELDGREPPETDKALQKLSQTVESYRQWIEALEAKEDRAREQQEQRRQQGLANAQNQLRELQRRQSVVSSRLDKASERSAEELNQTWPSVRLEQNSNIQGTRELEAQLRSLAPGASERIRAAVDAMEMTVSQGNEQQFPVAESASDMAGRLLQQAESAARRSQQDQSQRGRRRRVTSDQYYGNQVAGGDVDLKRDYEVNRRYREDVLEDVREIKKRESSDESDAILEDYLRKVIR